MLFSCPTDYNLMLMLFFSWYFPKPGPKRHISKYIGWITIKFCDIIHVGMRPGNFWWSHHPPYSSANRSGRAFAVLLFIRYLKYARQWRDLILNFLFLRRSNYSKGEISSVGEYDEYVLRVCWHVSDLVGELQELQQSGTNTSTAAELLKQGAGETNPSIQPNN